MVIGREELPELCCSHPYSASTADHNYYSNNSSSSAENDDKDGELLACLFPESHKGVNQDEGNILDRVDPRKNKTHDGKERSEGQSTECLGSESNTSYANERPNGRRPKHISGNGR